MVKGGYGEPMLNWRHPRFFLLLVLVGFSGAAGLVYEVMWVRELTHVFGNTTDAVTVVLSAFMGGLALGSAWFGQRAKKDRSPERVLVWLEVGVGVSALMTLVGFQLMDHWFRLLFAQATSSTSEMLLFKLLSSFLVLLPSTFLMGGTLPVLCQWLVRLPEDTVSFLGKLYGVNTLGAALGCFVAGFFLMEFVGVTQSIRLVALVNFVLAGFFYLFFVRVQPWQALASRPNIVTQESLQPEKDHRSILPPLVWLGLFAAGMVGLSYEVLWSRLLVFKLKMTAYAFSLMLTTFLLGLGLGSLIISLLRRRRWMSHPGWLFGLVQGLIGVFGLVSLKALGAIEGIEWFQHIGQLTGGGSWTQVLWAEWVLAGFVMLLPTMLMGMTLPLAAQFMVGTTKTVGATVGSMFAINTLGSIAGSVLTGVVMIRVFGTQTTMVAISVFSLFSGLLMMAVTAKDSSGDGAKRWLSGLLLLGAALGVWATIPGDLVHQYFNIYESQMSRETTLVYAHEGIEGVTTVHEYPDGYRGISTSSVNVAGTHYTHRTTQKLQAHLPMLVHPAAREVLQIGFGSGETSHLVTTYPIDRLDLVEISQEVIDTSTRFFRDINYGVVGHPKFFPIIMDGAHFVHLTDRRYDAILNDASWPGYVGCSALYTKDYFLRAKRLLKPKGIMTSWFPVGHGRDFRVLLATFREVFPHVSVWMAMTHVNQHALVLGSLEPLALETGSFLERFERFAAKDLQEVDLGSPVAFLDTFQLDNRGLEQGLDPKTPVHTLDRPLLEFTQRHRDPVENIAAIRMMRAFDGSVADLLVNASSYSLNGVPLLQHLSLSRQATQLVMEGYLDLLAEQEYQPRFDSAFKEAMKRYPQHPGALHFCSKMLNLHRQMAQEYAKQKDEAHARYCYTLAYQECGFLLQWRPEDPHLYLERAIILLEGVPWLDAPKDAVMAQAREDLSRVLSLNPQLVRDAGLEEQWERLNQAPPGEGPSERKGN
jgi:spermidine synthase